MVGKPTERAASDGAERGGQLRLSAEAVERIRQHVEASYPEEACGGLLGSARGDGVVEVAVADPLTNAKDRERGRRYLIGPGDVLALERRAGKADLEVLGYYHSHPDAPALPSEFDREHAWPWYHYVIVRVEDGRATEVRAWRLTDDRQQFDPVSVNGEERLKIEAREP